MPIRPLEIGPQLIANRPVERVFDVAQTTRDIGPVEDPVIVDQLHHDLTRDWIDGTVGQGCGERGDRVQVLGPEIAIAAQTEGAEPFTPFVPGDVERDPPERAAAPVWARG